MYGTVKQQINTIDCVSDRLALLSVLSALADRLSSQATTSAGLVISAGGATTAKTGSTPFSGVANGAPVAIAASTAMPALTGINTAAGQYVIASFFIDSASNLTVLGGNPGATLAQATFPQTPVGKALVGYLVIYYASAFTGGTTPLDTATTVYVSPVGAFDPTILIG